MNKFFYGFMLFLSTILVFTVPAIAQKGTEHSTMAIEKEIANAATSIPDKIVDVRYERCPIMGNEVDPEIATIFAGKVYHFCCKGCVESFKKDPVASIAKIKDTVEVPLTITNTDGKCPVMGGNATSEIFLIRGDKITFYCCAACVGKDEPESNKSSEE